MSAQATLSEGRRGFAAFDTIVACGTLPIVFVALGGFGVGLFLWYAATTQLGGGALGSDLILLAALVAGEIVSLAGWYGYGHYFSRRAGTRVVNSMRWDSVSWASLSVFAIGLVAPVPAISPERAAAAAVALFCAWKLLIAARWVHTVRDVLVTFVVTRLPIMVIAELASVTIAQRPGVHVAESNNPLLAVWGRWDAVHYIDIAQRGYYGTDMAFFPLYPELIRFVGHFIGNDLIAGLIISNVALFFGLLFFYKLVEHQFNRAVAHRAIFYVSIFPTAVFFSAVYTEALFFALTVASFYYILEHKWVTAGVIGALAALTRSEGVLLAIPFAIEVVATARTMPLHSFLAPARAMRIGLGLAAIPLGLCIYMGWLWILRGDPLYFSHVQVFWGRHLAWPWISVGHAYWAILHTKSTATVANQALEAGFTFLMILITFAGAWRLRLSYTAYSLASIVVPMSTSSLMSMPRFALVLFPMFVVLALWGGKAWANNAIVAFSLPLLGLFTVLFADWYWVA